MTGGYGYLISQVHHFNCQSDQEYGKSEYSMKAAESFSKNCCRPGDGQDARQAIHLHRRDTDDGEDETKDEEDDEEGAGSDEV